ncbi:TPA: catabolite repressor/activator [Photobacterium damselae]
MTLDEIAKLAGVSRTTASYVINGKAQKYRISEKTQQKVMAVVDEHNFRPDHAASSLRAGSSRSFGLIIPDLENTSYAKIAKLLERDARRAGYQLIIACSDDDGETEMKVAENLISRRIDALIVATVLPPDTPFYQQLQQKNVPIIAIDRPLTDEHFASVISEDLMGAYELTKAVMDKSIKTVGLIGAMKELGVSKEREQGFISAAQLYSDATITLAYGKQFSRTEGKKLVTDWVNTDTVPEVILATSYTLFEGVLDCLLLHPEHFKHVKLATFGDNRLLDFLPIKVQSLSQQFEVIAETALELALNASAKRYQAGVEVVPRKLLRR